MSDIVRRRGLFDPKEGHLEGDPEEGDPEEGNPGKGDPEANPEDNDVWQLSQIYKKRDRSYQKGREAATEYLHM